MQPLSRTLHEIKDSITAFLTRYQSRFDDRKDDHFDAMEMVDRLGTTAIEMAEKMESIHDAIGNVSWALDEMRIVNDEMKRVLERSS